MDFYNKKTEIFIPGRLCLFGEHSDWAGQMRKFNAEIVPGQALVTFTQEGIYATASKSDKLTVTSIDSDGNVINAEYNMELKELHKAASEGGFFSYIAGVAAYLMTLSNVGGLSIDCTKTTLPQKKGLSSSAAICTLVARAFNRIYGLNLTTRGEMEAAYGGEQLTPSRCGRLDQAVAFGRGIVDMKFDGDRLDVAPIKIGAPLYFVFADLNASKDTIAILRDLNNAYPYPRNDEHKALHTLLGVTNKRIIDDAITAFANGDSQRVGLLMTEAQELFDKYAAVLSPIALESPVLHKVLADTNIHKYSYGGKGVGSQGDGTVQFIARSEDDAEKLKEYIHDTLGLDCYNITVPKSVAVRKAVVTLAGYGTRVFPATKVTKKEFLTVIDTDKLVKPMLLILLESLVQSGIEEICLVIRPGEERLYDILFAPLPDEQLRKLPESLRRYNETVSDIGCRVHYVYQGDALGFGHAVLQSERFADGEPVLLMLGDHLFKSNSDRSCITQLIDTYERTKSLSIGLFELPLDDVHHYGIAKIKDSSFSLSSIVEKPSKKQAKGRLSFDGKYYGVFMYVLTPHVYSELASGFAEFSDNEQELHLTPALDAVAKKYGAAGVAIDGVRYDIGIPEQYRRTVTEYGL
jgi:UTP-glucose-1-phosphate uridylyltransferase/mevalonate kinase